MRYSALLYYVGHAFVKGSGTVTLGTPAGTVTPGTPQGSVTLGQPTGTVVPG